MTPREIVKRNAITYLLTHALLLAGLIYALRVGDMRAVKVLAFALAFLGPWCLVSTYLSAWRAWRQEPPDDVTDTSLPFFAMLAVALPLYWLL